MFWLMNPSSIHYVDFNTLSQIFCGNYLKCLSVKYSHSTKSALLSAALKRQSLSFPHKLSHKHTERRLWWDVEWFSFPNLKPNNTNPTKTLKVHNLDTLKLFGYNSSKSPLWLFRTVLMLLALIASSKQTPVNCTNWLK